MNTRRVGGVIVGLSLTGLAVLAGALFAAGVHKNTQITSLRRHGVAVEITVSGCLGLLGGSGSNAAGYSCRGSFVLAGHRENEPIPGDTLLPPGTRLRGVAVPGDPALVTTAGALAREHASWRVYIVPTVLAVVLVLSVGALVLRRRRPRRA
ncbi:MAG TPA: hypothetical protein VN799_05115 [Acidimicrobiales bacterium]|nr:hypothetical protein [Acidimicrobiales bacterium]